MTNKYVYSFARGNAEGKASMRELLGGKGANLAEMISLGIPVPPGFTITTEVCARYYEKGRKHDQVVVDAVEEGLGKLESAMDKQLGNPKAPLLVSVRSGAAVSMPGMMDTVLNLGMNSQVVDGIARETGNPRFAWDAYRRFIQMFGNVVKQVPHEHFEEALEEIKRLKGVSNDSDLDAQSLKNLTERYFAIYREAVGQDFPQDPKEQLWGSINAVFGSWNNDRAVKYRSINKIEGLIGTAVNVQSMVFGNFGETSGTGVCFSRDPSTGENCFYGEYLMNAQGEDVVAGIRTPQKLSQLQEANPEIYGQLVKLKDKLEAHYRDMQDIEFTIQEGKLYLLQTRGGKRTGLAAVQIAVDFVRDGKISKEEAILRVTSDHLNQLLHPMIETQAKRELTPIAVGLNASPGAATGKIVFTADEAEEQAKQGDKVLLVRKETSPEDIGGMNVAEGILTSTGGMTSHAAVVARGMGTPCVAGCKEALIDQGAKTLEIQGKRYVEGDWISLDGSDGSVYEGVVPLTQPELSREMKKFLSWTDEVRKGAKRKAMADGFEIRTNADLPADALKARGFGAEGIGLCRTEHMFFGEGKLKPFQRMIVAGEEQARREALKPILKLQVEDFKEIFLAMEGLPVNIRLLDPPLHEFVPHGKKEIAELADSLGMSFEKLRMRIDSLKEHNPMLGHRGCRLGITYPEIYEIQVEAIIRAAIEVAQQGKTVLPEIMIPLVGTVREFLPIKKRAERVIARVFDEVGKRIDYQIGTMIEVPRAAVTADEIAHHVDYFSFGTNDLTQLVFGYSRDDVGSFVPFYIQEKILSADPFETLDQQGVGQLIELGVKRGRSTKTDLKTSICGEHGGDPASIEFSYRVGLNTISCSPFRVPIARLAAAQAILKSRKP